MECQSQRYLSLAGLILLTLALVVSCFGAAIGHNMHQLAMSNHLFSHTACCRVDQNYALLMNHAQADFGLSTTSLLLFAIAVMGQLLVGFGSRQIFADAAGGLYIKITRLFYGSSQQFYYLTKLFSKGLLHPKVF